MNEIQIAKEVIDSDLLKVIANPDYRWVWGFILGFMVKHITYSLGSLNKKTSPKRDNIYSEIYAYTACLIMSVLILIFLDHSVENLFINTLSSLVCIYLYIRAHNKLKGKGQEKANAGTRG